MKYRKRPLVIEAVQLPDLNSEPSESVLEFLHDMDANWGFDRKGGVLIHTREGSMRANPNDWIIKGSLGEFYPCKPDVFDDVYEPLTD